MNWPTSNTKRGNHLTWEWFLMTIKTITKWYLDLADNNNTPTGQLTGITNWHGHRPWWRHQMETISAFLALCAGNLPVTGEFSSQMPVTRSFDVLLDLRPNKWFSKQSRGWWFETRSHPLWRHGNAECYRPPSYTLRPSNMLLRVCDDTILYGEEIKYYTAFVVLDTRRLAHTKENKVTINSYLNHFIPQAVSADTSKSYP